MRVWIDQDECTGDGICAEILPSVFFGHDDGVFYVKDVDHPDGLGDDGSPILKMIDGLALVPPELLDAAIEAAEVCPGECIHFSE